MRFAKLAMLWLCIIPLWALDTLVSTETKVQGYSQHRSADSDTLFSGQYLSAQNLSQQLAFLGFETKQEGGVGHFEPYSYRGFDSPHIPVTINGFDLSSIDGQVANLSKISLLWADTIILNKGSESQSHFASIDIRIPKEGTFISTSTSIPLANEFHLGINNHYQNFNFNHLISTQFYPNRFKYLDRNRTPYNTKDDKLRILDNGEYHAFNSFHQMTYTHENSFEWQTSVFLNSEGGGLHGREGLAADSAGYFQFKLGIQNSFNFKKHNYSNFNNWSNQGSYWSGDDHFYYQSKEATLLEQKLFSTKNTYTYKFLNYKIFNSKILMSSNLSYRFPLENSNPKFNWNWHGYKHNSLLSLFNTIQLNDNRFEYSIHLNMVYEKFKLSEKSFSNSDNDTYLFYNIKYHHNYNDHLNISINTNKFLREPELVQKYGGSTGILPSQDLIAETGYSHEISIQNNFKYFSQGIKTYLNQIEDKITPIKSVELTKFTNGESAKIYGLEYFNKIKLFNFDFQNHLFLNKSETEQTKKFIPYLSPMKYLSEITYSISQIKFGPSYEYRSSVYTDISNNTINGSYHQIHSFIKYQNEKISLLFNLNNIFDTYLENEYTSFPKAGRTYKITFQLNI